MTAQNKDQRYLNKFWQARNQGFLLLGAHIAAISGYFKKTHH